MREVDVVNRTRGDQILFRAGWCANFLCRLRGMTFRREFPSGEGLVLVEWTESRLATTIHMFFVPVSLGIAWLDAAGTVVQTTVARPWHLYVPDKPAQTVLEVPPGVIESVAVGDVLEFIDVSPDPASPS